MCNYIAYGLVLCVLSACGKKEEAVAFNPTARSDAVVEQTVKEQETKEAFLPCHQEKEGVCRKLYDVYYISYNVSGDPGGVSIYLRHTEDASSAGRFSCGGAHSEQFSAKAIEHLTGVSFDNRDACYCRLTLDHCDRDSQYEFVRPGIVFEDWIRLVPQYPALMKTAMLIHDKYRELAERRSKLLEAIAVLNYTFRDEENATQLQQDIVKLDQMLLDFIPTAQSFFELSRKYIAKQYAVSYRKEALSGLRTFEQSFNVAQATKDRALDEQLATIKLAVANLEKAINQ